MPQVGDFEKVSKGLRGVWLWNRRYLFEERTWGYVNRKAWADAWIERFTQGKKKKASLEVLTEIFSNYAAQPWYKRLSWRLTMPLSRLKIVQMHLQLENALGTSQPLRESLSLLSNALNTAQKEMSIWFWRRRLRLSRLNRAIKALRVRGGTMQSEDEKTHCSPLEICIRESFRKALNRLKEYGETRVHWYQSETHADLVRRRGWVTEIDCQKLRKTLATETLLDNDFTDFPGWLGRFNQRKNPEYTKERRCVYYQSLTFCLKELVNMKGNEEKAINEAMSDLRSLLCEGLLLGAKANHEKRDDKVWKIYRGLIKDLLSFGTKETKEKDSRSVLEMAVQNLQDELNRLWSYAFGKSRRDLHPHSSQKLPGSKILEAEIILRQTHLISFFKHCRARYKETVDHYNDQTLLFKEERNELKMIIEAMAKVLKRMEQLVQHWGCVGAFLSETDNVLIEGKEVESLKISFTSKLSFYRERYRQLKSKANGNLVLATSPKVADSSAEEAPSKRSVLLEATSSISEDKEAKMVVQLTPEGRSACATLGIHTEGEITWGEIRRAYKRMALRYHPDKQHQNSEVIFKEMGAAYRLLEELKEKKGEETEIYFRDMSENYEALMKRVAEIREDIRLYKASQEQLREDSKTELSKQRIEFEGELKKQKEEFTQKLEGMEKIFEELQKKLPNEEGEEPREEGSHYSVRFN